MTQRLARLGLVLLVAWLAMAPRVMASLLEDDGVDAFIDRLAARDGFDAAELRGLFEGVERRDAVLEQIAAPAESLPWRRYRPIFVTDERARAGVEFRREHADTLARAQAEYGVPAEIVTAIIGVETYYGRRKGDHPVLATLATLAFHYPPRAEFFRDELEQFLVLARHEGLDPRGVTGSYAGAMGMPQFISSSYRHYAVDFDADGRRDLWDSPADAIGSVAAYLADHGWQAGAPVAARAGGTGQRELVTRDPRPDVTAAQLRAAGIEANPFPDEGDRVTVLELDGADGAELWLGWRNFYAITRYNHSPLYAMAVHQLAERIRRADRATAER